jgi:cytochrome c oxidase subunit 2
MPIAVRAVSPEKFKAWADLAGKDLPGAYKALAASIAADKVQVAEAVK